MSKMLKVVGASWVQTKIQSYILGFLGVLALVALYFGQMERTQEDGTYAASVIFSEKTGYSVKYWGQSNQLADIPRGVARAYFRMDYDTTGWSILELETNGSYPDQVQAYAAGIIEGALTWLLIHLHLENTIHATCERTPKQCDKLRDALNQSFDIWKTHAANHEDSDPFWHQVSLYYTQISGIHAGWQQGLIRSQLEDETDITDLYWLNAVSEIPELQHKLNISILNTATEELPTPSSSFIRVVNETNPYGKTVHKILVANNAASGYNTMMKILKRYKLNYHQTSAPNSPPIRTTSIEFSGYPGAVTSQDEFYSIRGDGLKMAVVGTTIKNYNSKLWKDVNITEQVPLGPRISAANRLSTNASSWGHTLASSNSGTGCKQWMLLDLIKFDQLSASGSLHHYAPRTQDLPDVITENYNDIKHTVVHRGGAGGRARGLLYLLEQVPARTHSADVSDALLTRNYYYTHGLPVFKDIYEITNTKKMQELYGASFSESMSPRALAFKRGHNNATSLNGVIKLMRSINVTTEGGASEGQESTISDLLASGAWSMLGVRGDIVHRHQLPYGVIDTKVLRYVANTKGADFVAVAGPPYTSVLKSNDTNAPINKGNIAAFYTDQFDDQSEIDSSEILELYKHERDEAIEEYLEERDKHIVKPFQWSESSFAEKHKGQPDKWAFDPFKAKWSW